MMMKVRNLLDAIQYKQRKKEMLRHEVAKWGMVATAMYGAGRPELARQYLKTAQAFQDDLVRLDRSHKTSIEVMMDDRKRKDMFDALYPDSLDLFRA